MSSSSRRKTLSRSARLTMPASRPVASTTGSLLTRARAMACAASARVAFARTVTAGEDMRSPAVSASAFARAAGGRGRRRPLSGSSRSASLGQQIGLGDHTDHPALTLDHGQGADLPVVHQAHDLLEGGPPADGGDRGSMTSLTMCGVPYMVTP